MRKKWLKNIATAVKEYNLISYIGLLVMSILFVVFSGKRLEYNLGVVIQTTAPYIIIALGGVLIYSLGNLDISIGQQIGVYIISLILITNALGSTYLALIIAFIIVLIIAISGGIFNAFISAKLKLPSIVTSLFLMFFYTGVQFLLMEGTGKNSINLLGLAIRPADRGTYNLMLLAIITVAFLIFFYLYRYTRLGKNLKVIGENPKVATQSGINIVKWKIIAYLGFAIMLTIGTFLILTRTSAAGNGTGSGFHLDLMIILILGGMPLSGGMRSKISSAVVGSITYVLLSNVLATMGVDLQLINFIRAVIFIVIVLLTSRSKERILPR